MDAGAHLITAGDFELDDGLGEESGNPALRSLIESEIRSHGPVTFHRFMELALYHPVEGYYCGQRHPVGRSGDYVTSPEVSPLFGYALARQVAQLWHILGAPNEFALLEYGAGNGRLAQDLLRWIAKREPELSDKLTYTIVERSPSLRGLLRERFSSELSSSRFQVSDVCHRGAIYQCVIANELIDSFPVHRIRMTGGQLREVFVDCNDSGFVEVFDEASTPEIERYFSRLGFVPAEDCVVEVNLDAERWLAEAAKTVGTGFMLLLDYGYDAARLFVPWRRDGTLLCFHRHTASTNPYELVGQQDITCHIDFTTLTAQARDQGFKLLGVTDQSHFLTALGVSSSGNRVEAEEIQNHFAKRRAIQTLIDPSGLGRIGALLFGRDVPPCEPLGFSPGPDADRDITANARGRSSNG
jgi:SAM-dependent MidA family methyltransferase